MKKFLLSLAALLLLAACGSKKLPEGVIDRDRMVPLLVDVYLTEAYYGVETSYSYNYDSLSPEMVRAYEDLLAKHGITADELETSLDYYAHHPEQYNAIHHEVRALLSEDEEITDSVVTKPVKIELISVE